MHTKKNDLLYPIMHTTVEGFHVASYYEANFARSPCHVGLLFPQPGIVKHNKMSQNILCGTYHNNKLPFRK